VSEHICTAFKELATLASFVYPPPVDSNGMVWRGLLYQSRNGLSLPPAFTLTGGIFEVVVGVRVGDGV
jgi:hypothetical protein